MALSRGNCLESEDTQHFLGSGDGSEVTEYFSDIGG
jgi:hypothetical protein